MKECRSVDGQTSGHRLAKDRGKKRRRNNQERTTNPFGLARKHEEPADETRTDADVDGRKPMTTNRFLWSALGLYTASLVFFLIFAAVQTLPRDTTSYALAAPTSSVKEHIIYLRHRRLGPDNNRDDQDDSKHATSYAQRHHTFSKNTKYSSGTQHYYYGNGYGFEQETETTKNEVRRRYIAPRTNLSDVWLCLLTTLG